MRFDEQKRLAVCGDVVAWDVEVVDYEEDDRETSRYSQPVGIGDEATAQNVFGVLCPDGSVDGFGVSYSSLADAQAYYSQMIE